MNNVSIKFLHECFLCDPILGTLHWKTRPAEHFATERAWRVSNTKHAGKLAGCVHKSHGFVQVRFGGVSHSAHRIIFAMTRDRWPIDLLVHKDGDKTNNNIYNLDEVTYSFFLANRHYLTKG